MKLLLVRHSESNGNVDKSEYTRTLDCDIGLTEKGEAQARETADKILELLDRRVVGNVFYSSYKRAAKTAEIIYNRLNEIETRRVKLKRFEELNEIETRHVKLKRFEESPILREREWGGLRDIVTSGQKTEGHFNFFYRPLGGESFADCYNRVALFHQWLMACHPQDDNIIVAHGEFNKLYAMYLMRWSVKEFEKWRTPRNGEVMYFNDGELSEKTPLTLKVNKH